MEPYESLTLEQQMVTRKAGVHFKRPALVVSDLDRSLTLYRDILGFEPNAIRETPAGSFSYTAFRIPEHAKQRFVTLNSRLEMRVMAILEVKGIDLPSPPQNPFTVAHTIEVLDVESDMAKVIQAGHEVTESVIAAGEGYRYKEQALIDHDGHLVVLYELLQ